MTTWDELVADLGEDPENILKEVSSQYLNEINQLKEKLAHCSERIKSVRETQEIYKNIASRDNAQIERETQKLEDNQVKINSLKSRLNHILASDPNQLHLPTTHVDPDLITFKARNLMREITQDNEAAQRTGRYVNVNARIAEVRKLFNLYLIQLEDLNKQNRMVAGVLECLINLDVNYSFKFLHFCNPHFSQETEETLRKLKDKYSRNIPNITISN